jgi:tRNA pseudouridine55 synthase
VHIKQFEVSPLFTASSSEAALKNVDFSVICSKGTYIRSLAYDFGRACGSGAYLSRLKRTSIGDFQNTDAWHLDDFIALLDSFDK